MPVINKIGNFFVDLMKNVVYLFVPLIKKIFTIIPKKNNLWVFGAWGGRLYADNSKYMFEYINKNRYEIKAIWISRNRQAVQQIRNKGYRAYYKWSVKGIWTCIRAQVAFLTEGCYDISRVFISGAYNIQLWHGMGIKDITNLTPKSTNKLKQYYQKNVLSHENEYWMVACEDAKIKYSQSNKISTKNMFITGQPKDDTFINVTTNKFISEIRKKHIGCKIVVYLPTHRNFGNKKTDDVLSIKSLTQVNLHLKRENIVLIFKPHTHEIKNFINTNVNLSNVVFASDPNIYGDVYEFLPSCDALITDYSGIMLGYLTCEKPIIYFPYDYNEYINEDPGLYFSYDSVTAGPVCRTWDEVIAETAKIFIIDEYVERRHLLRLRFSPFNDGNNCKRVLEKVVEIVSN